METKKDDVSNDEEPSDNSCSNQDKNALKSVTVSTAKKAHLIFWVKFNNYIMMRTRNVLNCMENKY